MLLVLGCAADSHSGGEHAIGFRFEVQARVGSDVDAVTVNDATVPITAGAIDVIVGYSDYDEGMNAMPLEFDFFSMGARVHTGYASVGACQAVCAQEDCPDLSMFSHELLTEAVGDFQLKQYECLTCDGPTLMIHACPG